MSGDQTTYHVTSRDRAAQILAEGFTTDQVVNVHEFSGVRLMVDPRGNTYSRLGFRVIDLSIDGHMVPEWLLQEMAPDEDPRLWEPMPVDRIHDPIGHTVLEVTLGEDVSLDDYRYEEQITLYNRKTQEIRHTQRFEWTGEWLVPLDMAERAGVRLLERALEPEDHQAMARWRAHFEAEGMPQDEIQQRIDALDEELRAWEPGLG